MRAPSALKLQRIATEAAGFLSRILFAHPRPPILRTNHSTPTS